MGGSGNYVSTPDNASFPTSDATFIAWAAPEAISNSGTFIGKQAGAGARSVLFDLNGSNLRLVVYDDGTNSDVSQVSVSSLTDGVGYWFRATANFTTQKVDFYTSTQPLGTALDAINWTQLGTQQSTGGTGIFDSATQIEVGASGGGGGSAVFTGSISRAVVIASTDPTADPVVDFNANDYVSGVTFETPYSTVDPLANGGFDADSDWTLDANGGGGSVTISGGQLTLAQGGSSVWMAAIQAIDVSGVSSLRLEGSLVSSTDTGQKRLGVNSTSSINSVPNLGYTTTTSNSATDVSVVVDVSAYDTVYIEILEGQAAGQSSVWDNITVTPTGGTLWTLNGTAKVFSPFNQIGDLPGSSGDYFSTPDSAAASVTGDLTLVGWSAQDDWTLAETIVSKFTQAGNQRSYWLQTQADGTLRLTISDDGTAASSDTSDSTVATGFYGRHRALGKGDL
jgi:hypothetical protein